MNAPNTRPPLNGVKTHPLTPHARDMLERLANWGPRPAQSINAGVINRFLREDLIVLVDLPSPFATHKGRKIPHAQITEDGRREVARGPN